MTASIVYEWLERVRQRPFVHGQDLMGFVSEVFGFYECLNHQGIIDSGPTLMKNFRDWLAEFTDLSHLNMSWGIAIDRATKHPQDRYDMFFKFVDQYKQLVPTVVASCELGDSIRNQIVGSFSYRQLNFEAPNKIELVRLPEGLLHEDEPEPDQVTWRLVELELTKKNGDKIEVKLLRPLAWLEQAGAVTEGSFNIVIDELDVEGEAAVLRVLPCPPIQPSEGQVVTGTFQHSSDSLVELHVEGKTNPIICTSGHPIWSVTPQSFVNAGDLDANDMLSLQEDKFAFVLFARPHQLNTSVFNLEVNRTHVYSVGLTGFLVHNGVLRNCEKDIVRYGSEAEAQNSQATGGLHLDPSKNGKFKNVGDENWEAKTKPTLVMK